MKYLKFIFIFFPMSYISYAGVSDNMQSFFNKTGFSSNVTSAKSFVHQEGGHLSGGNGFIRTPVKNLQPIHVRSPSLKMGCSGIDINFGGFDFINSQKLIDFGKTVAQNATPFAVDLALQTWAPGIKSALDYLRDMANKINSHNISSCELSQLLVGGVSSAFMKKENAQFMCKTLSTHNNSASSWIVSKELCNDKTKVNQTNELAKQNEHLKDIISANRNIVWYALMQNAFLKENKEIAQYVMSITGTVVNIDLSDKTETYFYNPLVTDEKTIGINQMLFGTEDKNIYVYTCDDLDENKCLNLTKKTIVIDKKHALVPKITNILEKIDEKIIKDESLNIEEQNIINSINFPILRIMEINRILGDVTEHYLYADIIARTILSEYIKQLIRHTRIALSKLSHSEHLELLVNNLNYVQRNIINNIPKQALETLNRKNKLLRHQINKEKTYIGEMSAKTQNNYFLGQTI